MKEILFRIWLKNKYSPVLLVLHMVLFFLLLFLGVSLKGFPYSLILLFVVIAIKSNELRATSEIYFLIPMESQDKRKSIIHQCFFEACIWTIANTIGYLLTIHFSKSYQWDGMVVFFIILLTAFTFLIMFNYDIFCERLMQYGELCPTKGNEPADEENRKKEAKSILNISALFNVALMYLLYFAYYNFGNAIYHKVLLSGAFKVFMIILGMVILGGLLFCTKANLRKGWKNEY